MNATLGQQPPRTEQWATQTSATVVQIELWLRAAASDSSSEMEAASRAEVERHLDEARKASQTIPKQQRRGLKDRWRDTSFERARMHLQAAETTLVDLLPDAQIEALVPNVAARLADVLDRNDPLRIKAEEMLRVPRGPEQRAALKQAMETSYAASNAAYVRLRDFRNTTWVAAAVMTLFVVLLVCVVAYFPKAASFCFEPGVVTGGDRQPVQQLQTVCPSGGMHQPTGGDVLIVAGMGALGGALGAIASLRKFRGTSTPYSISTALAALKVPAGALSAIAGLLLLSGGLIPGLANLNSQREILAYALVFGIGQQLITRFADDHAHRILDKLPSMPSFVPASPRREPPVTAAAGDPAPAAQEDVAARATYATPFADVSTTGKEKPTNPGFGSRRGGIDVGRSSGADQPPAERGLSGETLNDIVEMAREEIPTTQPLAHVLAPLSRVELAATSAAAVISVIGGGAGAIISGSAALDLVWLSWGIVGVFAGFLVVRAVTARQQYVAILVASGLSSAMLDSPARFDSVVQELSRVGAAREASLLSSIRLPSAAE